MILLATILLQLLLVISPVFADPKVTVNGDQVITGIVADDVEQFLGLPFAEPPVGNLRFRHPVDYQGSYHNFQATKFSKSCLSINPVGLVSALNYITTPLNPVLGQISPIITRLLNTVDTSEDCLYLNIYRPEGTEPNARLPVMIWYYGGAFLFGAGSEYDGARYIKASERINQPVIVVTSNYRLGPYGFLGGSGIAAEGNGNAALIDQRKVMEWVQDHIADFGGDPGKVTIFGESAGAMSVFNHMIANDGDNTYKGKPLFHGVIMQSGGPTLMGSITDKAPQELYERFADTAGCGNLNDAQTLSCLRAKSVDTLQAAANSFSIEERFGLVPMFLCWSPRADGKYITKTAMELLSEGKIANVPYISAYNEDEGSLFGFVVNSNSDADWNAFLDNHVLNATAAQKSQIARYYPNNPSQGCPYGTGFFNNVTPQYKRFSSVLNDVIYTVGKRKLLSATPNVNRWSLFNAALHNVVPVLGTFHANDIIWQWFLDVGPYKVYQDYFIAFANHFDPNVGVSLRNWPKYSTSSKDLLRVGFNSLGTMKDNYREQEVSYIIQNSKDFVM